ncbi:hypothetical protein [Microbulbifer sp. GL-2]|uniref:hypothetical protein n=1 Tax=Microbulbifer sp. GL-2 TaxID=2591606 RepID=UPI001164F4A2|nr:hypothetical protein [Microbulbifer sp. GL-2]BBM02955.1 hypothetical protein GL2_30290 [Microbulbifer sp. GL-2]
MPRIGLISVLVVMACINVVLDFLRHASISDIHINVVTSALIAGIATSIPAGIALLISYKTRFKLGGINIYRLASDSVLGLSLLAWFYLLFIRERPEYYEGASHMYVATWPILLGVIAIVLYVSCLLVQGTYWAIKHNKSKQQGPSAGTR